MRLINKVISVILLLASMSVPLESVAKSLPIARDANQIITMDDHVYMQGKIPVVIMEIEPVSRDAKLYWGSMMSGVKSIPAKIAVTYAFAPDWSEYTIVAILFYDSNGNLLDQQETEGELIWEKTSQNSRARDMAAIAKGLPKKY